jgi:hypothetical protein
MAAPILRSNDTDDDGSGTTGTERNAAWKTAIYDAIDQATTDVLSSTATGTQNDFALGANGDVVLRWNGASSVTFTGFTNGAAGRAFILENVTAAQTLLVTHQGGGSTAGNRVICESAIGQYLGPGGRGLAVYDSTSSRWRFTAIDPGAALTIAFSAGNFTASAGTWTVDSGDVSYNAFKQYGDTLHWWFRYTQTDVSNAGVTLRVAVPGGFSVKAAALTFLTFLVRVSDAGAANAVGLASPGFASATTMSFFATVAGGTFGSTSSDNTSVEGYVCFPID